jgi:hypothetical protein
MRSKTIIFSIFVALVFTSCDVLNQSPQQSLPTDDIFTSETNVRGVLAGAYNGLQGSVPDDLVFTELAGDNAGHTGSFPSWASVDQHNLLASNAEARDMYINYYDVINTANNLISFTADVDDVSFSEQEKNEIIAQAKVIRAISYHSLVRWFGGVPLILAPADAIDESVNVPRSTATQVYDQILTDLTDAETVLGAAGSSGATSISGYAVKAYLARAYLYTEQYGLAETKASEVISSTSYSLPAEYSASFGVLEADGQGSSESIFELSYTTEDANSLSFFALPNGFGGRYEYGPEIAYINIYDPSDTRSATNLSTIAGDPVLGKYFRLNGNDNVVMIRLAEMYLIRAEAIAQQDYADPVRALAAQDDINTIRNRAGLGDVDPLNVTTLEEFMDELLLQRRIELDQEGHRWHDLVRTGRAVSTFGIDANYTLWPIPQREVDSNSGITPADQNPGY